MNKWMDLGGFQTPIFLEGHPCGNRETQMAKKNTHENHFGKAPTWEDLKNGSATGE